MLSKADNEFLTHSGPGTPMGELLRRFWMPALLSRGAARARRPAEEDQDPGRGPARLPRHRRPGRHRRAALPASRRQSLLRPQRGVRHPLRLPRLEVRRRRQLRRPADLAAGVLLQGHDQAAGLSDARMGATSSGSTWARKDKCRSCRSSSSASCPRRAATSPRSGRTATGCRASRARSTPRTSPSCTRCWPRTRPRRAPPWPRPRSPTSRRPTTASAGCTTTRGPKFTVLGHDAGLLIGGGAQDRRRRPLLAHLAVPDAQPRLHADRLPRRDLLRPVLGAGRRRVVLDLHLLLAARPAVQQRRAHQVRRRLQRPCRGRRRLRAAAQPAATTT